MTVALLKPGALRGRAVAAEETCAAIAAPGDERVDTLVIDAALLASAGGEYFSGCRFELR